jgi:predicted DNA-binding transcriptional regulator AlpA
MADASEAVLSGPGTSEQPNTFRPIDGEVERTGVSSPPDDEARPSSVTRRRLLRVVDVAKMLGVSKQRADQLRREPDFPEPVDCWARGDLWAAADVRRWTGIYAAGAARWGER